jgi:hypothetical protein
MNEANSGLVDIVREYLDVHERMVELFARFRDGTLDFAPVRDLCADDDRSPLFRLKERCHALFRRGGERAPMRRAALFDLAVGSLFHEAMKFRENYYQQVVYAPKVRALRENVAEGAPEEEELFREFDKIQTASEARMDEALQETEALLSHTGDQLWGLLRGRRDGLITRYLIEQRERIERIHPQGLEGLLETMHEDATAGHVAAGLSYLESAHFEHALAALTTARARSGEANPMLDRLSCYARGMRSFVEGNYDASLEQLDAWIGLDPDAAEARHASLAYSAISRVGRLVKDPALVSRAEALAARIEPLLDPQAARAASRSESGAGLER